MNRQPKVKRNYSALTLEEVMRLVGRDTFTRWELDTPPRPPSDALLTHLRRLEAFDLQMTEQAKALLIDALFAEVVSEYPSLKVWKAAPLSTDTLVGVADYLIAPNRAYLATPLLCVTEAKRDDFERGRVQCVAEMYACAWSNRKRGHETEVFGVVSNGQGWQFYRLARSGEVFETELYTTAFLPELLGALHYVCGECAKAVP